MTSEKVYAVILAGGSGTRFWPVSREQAPKQLQRITESRSMLALTLERSLSLVPAERIIIVTTRSQSGPIRTELRALNLTAVQILEEPAGRNTAPAIGLAALHVLKQDPQSILSVFPADHHIEEQEEFVRLVKAGAVFASREWLVTLGVTPTRAETGYGYIQKGVALEENLRGDVSPEWFRVAQFTEKPDRERAEQYLQSGDFFWNSGIFIWQARFFVEEMRKYLPHHYRVLREMNSVIPDASDGDSRREELYQALEAISVDYGILERSQRVAVIPADMGWSDVGSWESLREIIPKDPEGNVLQGDVIALDTRNSLVRSDERLVATVGVEGVVVVETADAVLVCGENRSQEVKRITEQLQSRGRTEARIHRLVPKPWGAYKVLDSSEKYTVKWLDVNPEQRLSYQRHEHRAEHWTVVEGTATVTLDDRIIKVCCGEHIYIPFRSKHRIENREEAILRIIEVQTGTYLGEDDIVRYEDDYQNER